MKKIFSDKNCEQSQLSELAEQISEELKNFPFFVCQLEGEMGAGKTTLTAQLLYKLGLDKKIPVGSPTYTYLNEYRIDDDLYAHLDLFRGNSSMALEDVVAYDFNDYKGFFIEWLEIITDFPIEVTHKISINKIDEQQSRSYSFEQLV